MDPETTVRRWARAAASGTTLNRWMRQSSYRTGHEPAFLKLSEALRDTFEDVRVIWLQHLSPSGRRVDSADLTG